MLAFLPARKLWCWEGKCTRRFGVKGKKIKKSYFKGITRGKETIQVKILYSIISK